MNKLPSLLIVSFLTLISLKGNGQPLITLNEINQMVKSEKSGVVFEILSKKGFEIVHYYDVHKETWQYQYSKTNDDEILIEYKSNDLNKMNGANGWEFGWFNKTDVIPPSIFDHPNTSLEISWTLKQEPQFNKLKLEIEKTSKPQSSNYNENLMTYIYTYTNETNSVTYKFYKSKDNLFLAAYYRSQLKINEVKRLTQLNRAIKDKYVKSLQEKGNMNYCDCSSFFESTITDDLYWYCEAEFAKRHNLKPDLVDEIWGNFGHDYHFQYEIDRKPELLGKIKESFKNECSREMGIVKIESIENKEAISNIVSIPFAKISNLSVLNVSICGYNFNYILDSGASDLTIDKTVEDFLLKCGLITKDNYLKPKKYILANGKSHAFKRVLIPKIKIGNLEIENVVTVIVEDKSPLLLGKGVLDRFTSWTINNELNVIEIKID